MLRLPQMIRSQLLNKWIISTPIVSSVRNQAIRRFSISPPTPPQKKASIAISSSRGPLSWASLALLVITGVSFLVYYESLKEKKFRELSSQVRTTGKPDLGGPFVLVDHNGNPVTDASYKGQFLLLYFGFTYCPDICPSELVKIGKIVDEVEKNKLGNLKPIFISVDPSRDTIGQMRHYSQDFHPAIDYLTGTTEQVAAVARAYRVYFSKVDEDADGEYLVDHSIVLYLLSPDGEFLDFFTQKMQISDITKKIGAYMELRKLQ